MNNSEIERYRIGVLPFAGDATGRARARVASELCGISEELHVRELEAAGPTVETERLYAGEANAAIENMMREQGVDVLVWATVLADETLAKVFLAAWSGRFDVQHFLVPALPWEEQRNVLKLGITTFAAQFSSVSYPKRTLQPVHQSVASLIVAADAAPESHLELIQAYAQAALVLGIKLANDELFHSSAGAFEDLIRETSRDKTPARWAYLQMNRGHALQAWAIRMQPSESGLLEAAASAYREALAVWTRDRSPTRWAVTQLELGNVLAAVGERDTGRERLDEAAAAYRAALSVWTRNRRPREWAEAQNALGTVLARQGDREHGTAILDCAITAYHEALSETPRESFPMSWAGIQSNLSDALRLAGQRETGTTRLELAVAAGRSALEEITRERTPQSWADTQSNLGCALRALGKRTKDLTHVIQSVASFRRALEVHTPESAPWKCAVIQSNLGNALTTMAELGTGTHELNEAVAAYRAALTRATRGSASYDWATAHYNLGKALLILGRRERSSARLEEAAAAYREALAQWTAEAAPGDRQMAQDGLDEAMRQLQQHRGAEPSRQREDADARAASAKSTLDRAEDLERRGAFEDCASLYEQVWTLASDDRAITALAATAALRRGDLAAEGRGPDADPVAWWKRAWDLRADNRASAVAAFASAWHAALELAASEPDAPATAELFHELACWLDPELTISKHDVLINGMSVEAVAAGAGYNRALVLDRAGQHAQAATAYDDVIDRFADSSDEAVREAVEGALTNRIAALQDLGLKAMSFVEAGRMDDAAGACRELRAHFRERDDARYVAKLGGVLNLRGAALIELGRFEEAIQSFNELIEPAGKYGDHEIREQLAIALLHKAIALAKLQRVAEALRLFELVVTRFSDVPEMVRDAQTHIATLHAEMDALIGRNEAQGRPAPGQLWAYDVRRPEGGVINHLSPLPPEIVSRVGLPDEAILGSIEPGLTIVAENVKQNPRFVAFLHEVIAKHAARCPALVEAARRQVGGYVYFIDARTPTPQGEVPVEDIIGAVGVQGGRIGEYQAMPEYRALARNGPIQLDPWFERVFLDELTARAPGRPPPN